MLGVRRCAASHTAARPHPRLACRRSDVGGCDEQMRRLQEVVELPLLQPERFIRLGMEPPRGALLCGPPGTGAAGLAVWLSGP